jgi:formate dehydrogenase subunit gamma
MMEKRPHARAMIVAGVLWLFAALYSPVLAQQPTSVNPMAQSVKEQELLKELNKVQGRGSIPDTKSYVIQQPAGRDWRQFHEVTLHWIAGIAILGMPVLLVGFFLGRGMIRIKSGRSGRTLVRFNGFERFVHWLTAVCFIVLGLTGLNITFGKELLLPHLGPEAFTEWSQWAKYTHNYASFPFTIGVVLIFLLWIAWNLPTLTDVRWLREGGGIIGHEHPPARRFNAGQKLIYWVVVLIGGTMAISGYILMFPFYETDISQMQTAQMVHAIAGVVFVAIMLAHIYIGTIGMEGAFEAMGSGEVDVNWAREHHSLWLENQVAKGRVRESPAPDGRAAAAE